MKPPSLFDPPPIERSQPALAGELELDTRTYRWVLHPERIESGWHEQRDTHTGLWIPPGWAFGMLYLGADREWRPVRNASRTWTGWQKVRELDEVRDAIRERTQSEGDT